MKEKSQKYLQMKNNKFGDIQKYLPITVQQATWEEVKNKTKKGILRAKNYQSNDVNNQQFYKPISKILKLNE